MVPVASLLRALLAALLVTACGSVAGPDGSTAPAPTPTPGDMSEVQAALALRGATIHEAVSGDPGCPGSELHSNAARLELSVVGDDQRYEVYLFRWRRPADFDAAGQAFASCVDAYVGEAAGDLTIDTLERPPWRAYGPAWSEQLRDVVDGALRDVGGG
ncbi:MAG TPA: hypothetical protein VH741_02385 [Candidatus Limnocylindrales bacterium]